MKSTTIGTDHGGSGTGPARGPGGGSLAAGRFTALLRETDDIERPAAGTDWTVAETAGHVSVVFTGFSAAIAGEPLALTPEQYLEADFPTRLAAINAATIAMVDHTDAGRLAELITVGAQRFLEFLAAADPELECTSPCTDPAGPLRGLPHRPGAVGS